MLTITMTVTGKSLDDIEYGIDEAKRLIVRCCCYPCSNSNEHGDYEFNVTGEEEGEFKDGDKVRLNKYADNIYEDGVKLAPGTKGVIAGFDANGWNYDVDFGDEGIWTIDEDDLELDS